jgi:uncharacterized protein (DUF58 family)
MNGPGELTLTSIVLFTLGAYGIAAGAASGEQTVVAVGVFAFVLFVIGIIWPIVALSGVGVSAWGPSDAVVGEVHDVHVELYGRATRVEMRVLDPPGEWWVTASPAQGVVPHLASRRGVFHRVRIELRTSAPLGVFVRTRIVRVELPNELAVAPRPSAEAPLLYERPNDGANSVAVMSGPRAGDTVRSVRPYVAGDPARLVHWPTTARRGTLVVREHEPSAAIGVALIVELNGDREEVERAASRAAGIGRSTLAAGGSLWLCTNDGGAPASARVVDLRDLSRRLARAGEGTPGALPPGWPVETVRAANVPDARPRPPADPHPSGPSGRWPEIAAP